MDGFEKHEHEADGEEVVDRDRDHTTARLSFTQLKKGENFHNLQNVNRDITMSPIIQIRIHTWCAWCTFAVPPDAHYNNCDKTCSSSNSHLVYMVGNMQICAARRESWRLLKFILHSP